LRTPVQSDHLLPFLRERAPVTPLTASVCTGAFLLGRAGLLDGLSVTTNHLALSALAAEIPAAHVEGGKLIDTGRLATAAGVSSGIDLALHLMERWFGPEARRRAAEALEGPWS
jgi:transcriptional regulator GlxA family with amidase domain